MSEPARDIKAVAAAAGVSIATVSHVLNDRGRVSEATRSRVRGVAADLGYVPNHLARGLRRQRSETVGLIGDDIVTTPWAGRMIAGVQDAAKAHGSLVLILSTDADPDLEQRQARLLRQRRVDGVLYAAMFHRVVTVPAVLSAVPVVLLDATSSDGALPSVVPDEEDGGRVAVGELLRSGHSRIAFINSDHDIPAAHGRRRGVEAAAGQAGTAVDALAVTHRPPTPDGGYHGAMELLRRPDRPTGIFCFSDTVAMGCYQAAAELGLRIPADLSVVGFDDVLVITEGLRPALTTIALPHYEMGVWAVDQLYARLAADQTGERSEVVHMQLPGALVRRSSVGPPASF
jgi:LacI family transcriptional regulator